MESFTKNYLDTIMLYVHTSSGKFSFMSSSNLINSDTDINKENKYGNTVTEYVGYASEDQFISVNVFYGFGYDSSHIYLHTSFSLSYPFFEFLKDGVVINAIYDHSFGGTLIDLGESRFQHESYFSSQIDFLLGWLY